MPHQQFVYTRLFHLHMTRSNAAPFPQRSQPVAFRPQQLTVVANLLLQADSEGPPFIFDTASCSCKHVLDTTPRRSCSSAVTRMVSVAEVRVCSRSRICAGGAFRPIRLRG